MRAVGLILNGDRSSSSLETRTPCTSSTRSRTIQHRSTVIQSGGQVRLAVNHALSRFGLTDSQFRMGNFEQPAATLECHDQLVLRGQSASVLSVVLVSLTQLFFARVVTSLATGHGSMSVVIKRSPGAEMLQISKTVADRTMIRTDDNRKSPFTFSCSWRRTHV